VNNDGTTANSTWPNSSPLPGNGRYVGIAAGHKPSITTALGWQCRAYSEGKLRPDRPSHWAPGTRTSPLDCREGTTRTHRLARADPENRNTGRNRLHRSNAGGGDQLEYRRDGANRYYITTRGRPPGPAERATQRFGRGVQALRRHAPRCWQSSMQQEPHCCHGVLPTGKQCRTRWLSTPHSGLAFHADLVGRRLRPDARTPGRDPMWFSIIMQVVLQCFAIPLSSLRKNSISAMTVYIGRTGPCGTCGAFDRVGAFASYSERCRSRRNARQSVVGIAMKKPIIPCPM